MSWRRAYELGWSLARPWLELPLRRHSRRDQLAGRRGHVGTTLLAPCQRRAWIHAVSLGEMRAAQALIERFAGDDHEFVLTAGNRAGLAAGQRIAAKDSRCRLVAWMPWDREDELRRFLSATRPTALVLLETEIWPTLLRICAESQVPVFWANARIYPRDLRRYRWARPLLCEPLGSVRRFAARSAEDAHRLRLLGAPAERIEIAGDLKSLFEIAADAPHIVAHRPTAGPPLVLGACTAPGEELVLLTAARELQRLRVDTRLVLAPRDTDRARALLHRIQRKQGEESCVLWSKRTADDRWRYAVVDQHGILPSIYPHAAVAFVGGSLARKGGHSPYEALVARTPIVVGSHVEHFSPEYSALRSADALLEVRRPAELIHALRALVESARHRRELTDRAAVVLRQLRGHALLHYSEFVRELSAHALPPAPTDRAPPAGTFTRPRGDAPRTNARTTRPPSGAIR